MNLVELIINKMPKNLNKLEQARFTYIELGRILEFDTTTIFNSNFDLFDERKNKDIDITNLDSNLVNCFNWANIYTKLLQHIDIKAEMKHDEHAWVILEIDNDIIFADATAGAETDLAKIKSNVQTDNFYLLHKKNVEFLAPMCNEKFLKKIDSIDEKLGIKKKRETTYTRLEKAKKEVNNIQGLSEKVDYIFHHIDASNLGFFEGNYYIKYILTYCLDRNEMSNIKSVTLSKTLLDGTVNSIKCLTVEDKKRIKYYIFCKNKGIYSIEKEKLEKIFQMGYSVEGFKEIEGIDDVPDFSRYNFTEQEQKAIKKESLYTRLYSTDNDLNFDSKQKSR